MAVESRSGSRVAARYALALLVVAAVIAYLVQSLRGRIQRIDTAGVALIVLAAVFVSLILSPGLIDRFSRIEVSGLKLEILQREQLRQREELLGFSDLLPILLPEAERNHLKDLAYRRSSSEKGSHDLRTRLRRLRSAGLIQMVSDHHISEIRDGLPVDLARYTELTALGKRWVQRIDEAERAQARDAAPDESQPQTLSQIH